MVSTIEYPFPPTESVIRITDSQAVDLNVVFENDSAECRGIQLFQYKDNSSYKPDTSGGMLFQYCWNRHTGMQIAFTGSGDLYIRWNLGAIGSWRKLKYDS